MPDRLLVVDASLAKRLSTELKGRGRESVSVAEVLDQELKDPVLLPLLAGLYENRDWTLITGDDVMPGEHAAIIAAHRITVATVDGRWENSGLEKEAFKREVVHRWAHRITEQELGTIRRYGLHQYRPWTHRR